MSFNKKDKTEKIKLYGSVKVLCLSALLTAMSVILAFICKLYLNFDVLGGSVRITFENLPIIFSGIAFGPLVGTAVGASADIINTAVSKYGIGGINPIITLGSASIGFLSGLIFKYYKSKSLNKSLLLSVSISHLIGSVIIKSLGLYLYHYYVEIDLFGIKLNSLFLRIPTYIIIGFIEYKLISVFLKNQTIKKQFGIKRGE